MEIRTFALIACFKLYQPEKKVITESREFQPFDVPTLQQVFSARFNRHSGAGSAEVISRPACFLNWQVYECAT
jgi:hypothetical protein